MDQRTELPTNPLLAKLHKLTTINNQLKEAGLQQSLQPPRIVTIGTQSSGKSSVLESILGFDLLPKGEGVITRRPIEIKLVHIPSGPGENPEPYVEFPQEDYQEYRQKYYYFEQVTEKLSDLMEKARPLKVVDDPIPITIYSPDCPDLTLVDLPGITRVSLYDTSGIEKVTKDLSRKYVKDPGTIILSVITAFQDLETSDTLAMAFEEDPEGVRTTGVITKIDIMDRGTNARRILLNQEVHLKLGYIGLKERSQLDLLQGMKVMDGMKIEKEFFASHPAYSTLPQGLCGTENLIQKISEVIFLHIRKTVPEICKEVHAKIKECEVNLIKLELCQNQGNQIIAEKESLKKTLEVLRSLQSTLNNDPDFASNPQDEAFFNKRGSHMNTFPPPMPVEKKQNNLFGPKGEGGNLFGSQEQKKDNAFIQKQEANLFGTQEPKNNPFAPKRGLFG